MVDTPIKRCSKCKLEKPITDFVKCKRCTYGVSRICKSCNNADVRDDRKANPEKYRGYCRKYRNTHLAKERARDRRRVPEKLAAAKLRRSKNPTKVRAYHNTWRRNNRDRVHGYERTFAKRHPEAIRIKTRRREAKKALLPATFTQQDWERCLEYFGHRCAVCNRPRGLWHTLAQDHWIPLSKGGAYVAENIVPLCHGVDGCNNLKKDSDPIEWLLHQYSKSQMQPILERIHTYFEWIKGQAAH